MFLHFTVSIFSRISSYVEFDQPMKYVCRFIIIHISC
uniref:Uncharacterized protein n=1 Tax=Rhizophora mucronata TaxID=61149 RepID=A0A2P2PQ45_RHIMU